MVNSFPKGYDIFSLSFHSSERTLTIHRYLYRWLTTLLSEQGPILRIPIRSFQNDGWQKKTPSSNWIIRMPSRYSPTDLATVLDKSKPNSHHNYAALLTYLSLAYAEMRLIVAKLLWNFDMKLKDDSYDWTDQSSYVLWEKNPLMVTLTPVQRRG